MIEESIRQKFRLKNIDEIRNYFIQEINQNGLLSKRYKNFCTALSYTEHLLILASAVTGCFSTFVFTSLVGLSIIIATSTIGYEICAITSGIKNNKSVIKERKKKLDKLVCLAKLN